jgi:hypothetical protein
MGFARPIAMKYYAHKSIDMLERKFLDNGINEYVELCKEFMQ